MSVLVFAGSADGRLDPAAARAVTAAVALGGPVAVLAAGPSCADAATAAVWAGVAKVLVAESPALASAEAQAALLARLAEPYAGIVAPATAWARSVLPRLAGLIDRPMLSDATAVLDPDTVERPIYAGSLIETVRCPGAKIVTVRTTAFAPCAQQTAAPTEAVGTAGDLAALDPGLSQCLGEEHRGETGRPDLAAARLVVAGGRGVGGQAGFDLVAGLADALGAGLGASRAAVDAGYAPNEAQVGQSGRTIAPDLYLAVGISGAIQHLAGIRDAKVIAAIDKDPEAPIFKVADFGLVADLFAAVPAVRAALDKDHIST